MASVAPIEKTPQFLDGPNREKVLYALASVRHSVLLNMANTEKPLVTASSAHFLTVFEWSKP